MTTLNTPPPTSNLGSMQKKIVDRLTRLGSRIRRQIALDGLTRSFAVLAGLLALSVVLDWWLELSRPVRVVYWLVTLAAAAHFLYHYALKPLAKRFSPIELAEAVDHASGAAGSQQVAPRVATVLQLPGMLGDEAALSSNMIHSAVERSYHSLEGDPFERHVNQKHAMWCGGALLAAILIPTVIALAMQYGAMGAFGTWASRWLAFSDTPYTRNTTIVVEGLDDGRLVVPRNEAATVRVTITNADGSEPREVEVRTEVTAQWEASSKGLVNLKHEKAIAAGLKKEKIPISIIVGVISHPEAGDFLVDSGINTNVANGKRGAIRGLVGIVAGSMKPLESTASLVTRLDLSVSGVLLTHSHFDHIMGLPDLPSEEPR